MCIHCEQPILLVSLCYHILWHEVLYPLYTMHGIQMNMIFCALATSFLEIDNYEIDKSALISKAPTQMPI